jgi:hypothetical protein
MKCANPECNRGMGLVARPLRRLQEQCRAVSRIPDLLSQVQAAVSGNLGQERPVFPAARRRGVQA